MTCGRALAFLCFLLSLTRVLHSQATYTATRGGQIQAGVGFLHLNNDYTTQKDEGMSVWVDASLTRHIGVEGEAHFGTIVSPSDVGENSYLVGPRFTLSRGRATGYAKVMFGRGSVINDFFNTSSSFNLYAFGGGADFRLTHRLSFRVVDVEYQRWPGFGTNGLTPFAISTGLMYRIR